MRLPYSSDDTLVDRNETSTRLDYSGRITPRPDVKSLKDLKSGVTTPLDLMARTPLDEFLTVTAQVGLAEPQLFVRPTTTLSSGQKYRLQVALSILTHADILVIDNFCENVDRFTISAICRGLRRLADTYGIGVLVATAAYERILDPSRT